jgi:N-acetylmuramoyl-L-alanine amidase
LRFLSKKSKVIARILVLIFILTNSIGIKINAYEGMGIIKQKSVKASDMKEWAIRNNATQAFANLAKTYYELASNHGGVDPTIAYAQAAKETNFGRFGGPLDETYKNPAGLKIGQEVDNSNEYQRFNSWEDGISAHLDYLVLYVGADGYPRINNTRDSEQLKELLGQSKTVEQLGDKWLQSDTYGIEIINMVSNIQSISNLNPITWIDSPTNGQVVNQDKFNLYGWAINKTGIKDLNVYINGALIKGVNERLPRQDVKDFYPLYSDAENSGFSIEINSNILIEGKNTVKVEAIGNDGVIQSTVTTFNYEYLTPKLYTESPMNNSTYSKDIEVNGWTLNKSGIKEVKIYIDNTFKGNANIGIIRQDINKIFSEYKNSLNSGYSFLIKNGDLSPGEHTIKIESIGNDGTIIRDNAKVIYKKLNPILYIDSPKNNSTISGKSLTISGWTLNQSGVKEVSAYIDGNLVGKTDVSLVREDVGIVYNEYYNSRVSGFSLNINSKLISKNGSTVNLKAIGNDGSIKEDNLIIKREGLNSLIFLDTPYNNQSIGTNTELKLNGWALNESGIKEVRVYLDNKLQGNANYGNLRPDVATAFPNYDESKTSGYEYKLNFKDVSLGIHEVKIVSIGNDNTMDEVSTKIQVIKLEPKIFIDTPTNLATVNSQELKVNGWALNESGIKKISVYIDDVFIKDINDRVLRPDIKSSFPLYPESNNAGYDTNIDISKLSIGNHKLTVIAEGNNGFKQASIISFNYKNYIIIVDPGHGGKDGGATSIHNGIEYKEDALNFSVSMKLKSKLESMGYYVVLTRQAWEFVDLVPRANYANSINADLFISIHHNSADTNVQKNPGPSGVETHYSSYRPNIDNEGITTVTTGEYIGAYIDTTPTEAAKLSKILSEKIVNNLASYLGRNNRGARDHNLAVTKYTNMPSVLVECGFISNPNEAADSGKDDRQQTTVNAIADAVGEMF